MPERRKNDKTQIEAQGPPAPQPASAQTRLAAVVEAAYILEARTR
jgi:hypothetical protein